jgi:aspartyl aminopeptidase
MKKSASQDFVTGLLGFIDASPTPYHAVANMAGTLKAAGFQEYNESESWDIEPGQAGFVVRNQSALAIFQMGETALSAETGFRIIAAHTDSPALKLKHQAAQMTGGCLRIPVEIYGSTIHSSWLDRPLGVAGRIVDLDDPAAVPELVCSGQPLAVIPNVAPHMSRDINEGFRYNPQQHLAALFGKATLEDLFAKLLPKRKKRPSPDALVAELFLYETESACLTGLTQQLILAPRLDNLASCYAAVNALCNMKPSKSSRVLFLADNEEVGSTSMQGANSAFLRDFLTRLMPRKTAGNDLLLRMLAQSSLLSADAAHALHPNFPEVHDPAYAPELNRGVVIKNNASLRYASNAISQAELLRQCRKNQIPVQYFAARSDKGCGSTIGPLCSALLGIPALDLGLPLWGMHSIRETTGREDPVFLRNTFTTYWNE